MGKRRNKRQRRRDRRERKNNWKAKAFENALKSDLARDDRKRMRAVAAGTLATAIGNAAGPHLHRALEHLDNLNRRNTPDEVHAILRRAHAAVLIAEGIFTDVMVGRRTIQIHPLDDDGNVDDDAVSHSIRVGSLADHDGFTDLSPPDDDDDDDLDDDDDDDDDDDEYD